MTPFRSYAAWLCMLAAVFAGAAHADAADDLHNFVDSIQSVDQVKMAVAKDLRRIAACGTGSCVNDNATELCAYVAALDLQLADAISDPRAADRKDAAFPIRERDLQLFRSIWSGCKPTTYQFWNYGQVLHVWYDPDEATDARIRAALGVPRTR